MNYLLNIGGVIMKRSLAYITAAWRGDPAVDMEQAAHYCRVVYDAGYSPICPMLYLQIGRAHV